MVKRQTTFSTFSKVTVNGQLKFIGNHNQCCAYVIREVPASVVHAPGEPVSIDPIPSEYQYAYTEGGNAVFEHIRNTPDILEEFRKAHTRFKKTENPYEFKGRVFEIITDVLRLKGQRVTDKSIREVFTGLCAFVGLKTSIY